MISPFAHRKVLVTGSTQNLGFTIARTFAREGAHVIVHGPGGDEARQAAERIQRETGADPVEATGFDLGRQASIEEAFAELGQKNLLPDVLINNAAHLGLGTPGFLEQTPEFFREVQEVNVLGVLRCSQLAAAHMKELGGGSIINISSLAGERAIHGRSAYDTSKAALTGLTRAMAIELAPFHIQVNAIAPGYIWTPRWDGISAETENRRRANIPCHAPTQQEEIAELVLFLASGKAPTLLGANILIDGGLGAQQVPGDTAI